jgi:hypothetical protein
MKKWTVRVFGCRVLEVEVREEVTAADVVQAMVAQRLMRQEEGVEVELIEADENGMIACECCGEMFDPTEVDQVDEDEVINTRFADMTERIVWDARPPADDDDEDDEGK